MRYSNQQVAVVGFAAVIEIGGGEQKRSEERTMRSLPRNGHAVQDR